MDPLPAHLCGRLTPNCPQYTGPQAGQWTRPGRHHHRRVGPHLLHPSGRWQRAPDDDQVDAALLLPAVRGGIAPDDPRTTATLTAVEKELCQDGYIYRYRHDDRPLHDAEGAFSALRLRPRPRLPPAGPP